MSITRLLEEIQTRQAPPAEEMPGQLTWFRYDVEAPPFGVDCVEAAVDNLGPAAANLRQEYLRDAQDRRERARSRCRHPHAEGTDVSTKCPDCGAKWGQGIQRLGRDAGLRLNAASKAVTVLVAMLRSGRKPLLNNTEDWSRDTRRWFLRED